MKLADIPQLNRLSVSEKLLIVEELWDDIAAQEGSLPLPSWHEQALAEDAARYQAHPTEGAPWPEVKQRILGGK
jgi:putative addiction module component (TIGR02574 family)